MLGGEWLLSPSSLILRFFVVAKVAAPSPVPPTLLAIPAWRCHRAWLSAWPVVGRPTPELLDLLFQEADPVVGLEQLGHDSCLEVLELLRHFLGASASCASSWAGLSSSPAAFASSWLGPFSSSLGSSAACTSSSFSCWLGFASFSPPSPGCLLLRLLLPGYLFLCSSSWASPPGLLLLLLPILSLLCL